MEARMVNIDREHCRIDVEVDGYILSYAWNRKRSEPIIVSVGGTPESDTPEAVKRVGASFALKEFRRNFGLGGSSQTTLCLIPNHKPSA
ncbi:MAG: hypothetical protein Q8Q20_05795 [bacterium]|nr:hypothetical protein [bacterium]